MNIRGLIPRNFAELAEVIPIAKTTGWDVAILHRNYHWVLPFQVCIFLKNKLNCMQNSCYHGNQKEKRLKYSFEKLFGRYETNVTQLFPVIRLLVY